MRKKYYLLLLSTILLGGLLTAQTNHIPQGTVFYEADQCNESDYENSNLAVGVLPKSAHAWEPEESDWQVIMYLGPLKVSETISKRTVKKEGNYWMVSDISYGRKGEKKDIVTYDLDGNAIRRLVTKKNRDYEMDYNCSVFNLRYLDKEITLESEGQVVCEGAGFGSLLGKMGLKKGDQLSYDIFDIYNLGPKKLITTHMGSQKYDGSTYDVIEAVTEGNDKEKVTYFYQNNEIKKMNITIPALGFAMLKITKL